jgi:hypothetical protein
MIGAYDDFELRREIDGPMTVETLQDICIVLIEKDKHHTCKAHFLSVAGMMKLLVVKCDWHSFNISNNIVVELSRQRRFDGILRLSCQGGGVSIRVVMSDL